MGKDGVQRWRVCDDDGVCVCVTGMGKHSVHISMCSATSSPLDKTRSISKRVQCLRRGALEVILELLGVAHDAHALAAASKRRLDDHREAVLVAEGLGQGKNSKVRYGKNGL